MRVGKEMSKNTKNVNKKTSGGLGVLILFSDEKV